MTEISYKTKEIFIKKIINELRAQITGSDLKETFDDRPSRTFFIGTLCTQDIESGNLGSELLTMVKPFSMGAEFLVSKNDAKKATLQIKPKAAFYYRVFPSYEKQLEFMREKFAQTYPDEDFDKFMKASIEGEEEKDFRTPLLKAYKKLIFPKINLTMDLSKSKDGFKQDFKKQIETQITTLISQINKDEQLFHTMKHPSKVKYKEIEERESITFEDVTDNSSFEKRLVDWSHNAVVPSWDFNITCEVSEFDEKTYKIKILFINECKQPSGDSVENYVFEADMELELENGLFQDFVFDYLKDNYKYDGNVNASGINCSAIMVSQNKIITDHMPLYFQPKQVTNNEIIAKFADLANQPLPVLKEVLDKMEKSFQDMKEKKDSFVSGEGKEALVKQMKYDMDMELFNNEIVRFKKGIEILEKYPKMMESFKLMNESFLKSAKGYESWRLFQLIFIIMNIPDVAKSEYKDINADPEIVDVIYFPTGGGKTEAYLGLVVLTAFFDRLRGKFAGVTAITKFPLRLLSLQQLQRIADIFAKAELVRREHSEISKGNNEPFSMGYYVGKSNTPNVLIKKDDWGSDENNLQPLIDNEDEREKLLIISKCPFCESKEHKVMIKPDIDNVRLLHVCSNPGCQEVLPVFISDVEVYRYIPTFIIGTLDKIPICGYQANFRNIYGQVHHKCPKHGYMSTEKCSELKAGCDVPVENYEEVDLYDPTPTLQIQDEMHLIRESFGSFDAHYETYLMNLQKRISGKPLKIIAATATINDDFHMQVKHLYGREKTCRFPSSGPDRKKSFYSMEDPEGKISRIIVGLLPHNKTIRFSVIDVIKYFTKIIRNYWENPEILLSDLYLKLNNVEEVYLLLKDYTTILEYNLAKRDGAAINQSVGTMINPFLKKIGLSNDDGMNFVSMTGDVRFRDVRAVLDKLENFEKKPDIDLITATSMISHGVDIDSLNFMLFHGMPGNTAEYVQAYSRVGRKHPGIVFIVLNPTRERDQSYYKYFQKFHEFQDLLVESVPINRWAKFSISRTLPGIFVSALMHYFDLKEGCKRLDLTKGFQEAYQDAKITHKEIQEFLLESYQTKNDDLGNNFKRVIEKTTSQYIDQILQNKNQKFIPMMISDSPMTSLRDIDEQIEIKITPESAPAMMKIAGVTENNRGDNK